MNNQSQPINVVLPEPYFQNGPHIQNQNIINNVQLVPGTIIAQNVAFPVVPIMYNNNNNNNPIYIANPHIYFTNSFIPNQQQIIYYPNNKVNANQEINETNPVHDFNNIEKDILNNNNNIQKLDQNNIIENKELNNNNIKDNKNINLKNQKIYYNNIYNINDKKKDNNNQKKILIKPVLIDDNANNIININNYYFNNRELNNYQPNYKNNINTKNENIIFKPKRNLTFPSKVNNDNKIMINPNFNYNQSILNTNQNKIYNNNKNEIIQPNVINFNNNYKESSVKTNN